MAENLNREELLDEIMAAIVDDVPRISENDIPLKVIADRQGIKTETAERRLSKKPIPGWEITWRRNENGHALKCLSKIDRDG